MAAFGLIHPFNSIPRTRTGRTKSVPAPGLAARLAIDAEDFILICSLGFDGFTLTSASFLSAIRIDRKAKKKLQVN
jgi:hypothetical protein